MNSLIKMEKNKNLLIFTNVNFPYKISYDLNTGEYQRISENGTKKIKTIKPFFANVYYLNIINKGEFPIYYEMLKMVDRSNNLISNMRKCTHFFKRISLLGTIFGFGNSDRH